VSTAVWNYTFLGHSTRSKHNSLRIFFVLPRKMPHVHFQLSTIEPETNDMPGAVTMADRARALIDYPDPRLVLGALY